MKEHRRRPESEVFAVLLGYLTHLRIPTKKGRRPMNAPLWNGKTLDMSLVGILPGDLAHEIAHWVLERDRRSEVNYGWTSDYQYAAAYDRFDHNAEVRACALGITMLNLAGSADAQGTWSDYSFFEYRPDPRQPDDAVVLRIGREAISGRGAVAAEVNDFKRWLAAQQG